MKIIIIMVVVVALLLQLNAAANFCVQQTRRSLNKQMLAEQRNGPSSGRERLPEFTCVSSAGPAAGEAAQAIRSGEQTKALNVNISGR